MILLFCTNKSVKFPASVGVMLRNTRHSVPTMLTAECVTALVAFVGGFALCVVTKKDAAVCGHKTTLAAIRHVHSTLNGSKYAKNAFAVKPRPQKCILGYLEHRRSHEFLWGCTFFL